MKRSPRIGFLVSVMADFDAVLAVPDVRQEAPEYLPYVDRLAGMLGRFGTVSFPGIAYTKEQARAAAERFLDDRVDLVVFYAASYAFDDVVMQALSRVPRPVLVWNTQSLTTLPPSFTFGQAMANEGLSSVPEVTNVLFRHGRYFRVVTGLPEDEEALASIGRFVRAAYVARVLQEVKLGMMGPVYPGIVELSVDEISLAARVGPTVERLEIEELVGAVRGLREEQVQQALADARKRFRIEGPGQAELLQSVRLSLALAVVTGRHGVDAVAFLCQHLVAHAELGVAPCYGASLLADQGIPFTCESDLGSAVAAVALRELGGTPMFTEFYSNDLERGLYLLSHCGYGTPALARDGQQITLKAHPCFPGPRGNGATLEYLVRPGTVTLLSLTPSPSGNWRFVATVGESVEGATLPMCTPHMLFRFNGPASERLEAWCRAGGMHHLSFAHGDFAREIALLAEMRGLECEIV